jgi:hypothetical protein
MAYAYKKHGLSSDVLNTQAIKNQSNKSQKDDVALSSLHLIQSEPQVIPLPHRTLQLLTSLSTALALCAVASTAHADPFECPEVSDGFARGWSQMMDGGAERVTHAFGKGLTLHMERCQLWAGHAYIETKYAVRITKGAQELTTLTLFDSIITDSGSSYRVDKKQQTITVSYGCGDVYSNDAKTCNQTWRWDTTHTRLNSDTFDAALKKLDRSLRSKSSTRALKRYAQFNKNTEMRPFERDLLLKRMHTHAMRAFTRKNHARAKAFAQAALSSIHLKTFLTRPTNVRYSNDLLFVQTHQADTKTLKVLVNGYDRVIEASPTRAVAYLNRADVLWTLNQMHSKTPSILGAALRTPAQLQEDYKMYIKLRGKKTVPMRASRRAKPLETTK